jgi:hypothetical protein
MEEKEEKNYTGVIPGHEEGKLIDTVSSVELESNEAAKAFFATVKGRLLDVNRWHDIAGVISASFQLVDENGNEVDRLVQKGDYFKIDIPVPGSSSGEGYDWVQVEDLKIVSEEDVESVGIRVRPVTSPVNENKDIAHFYSEESTSSFTVTREKNKITAGIYDRNTKPNKDADTIVDKVRDTVTGAGAVTIFSKLQWKSLAEGLLAPYTASP